MPGEMVLQQTPEAAALLEGRERLAGLRVALREREAEVEQVRAQLKVFEMRYLRQVGGLYAELDEWEARIAEREVDLYDSEPARRRAREARERARETLDATSGEAGELEEVEPPPGLKALFREVAKRIHPDYATDDAERTHLTLLMMRANQAYGRGDVETLQRLLDDYSEVNAASAEEGAAAELQRMLRQVRHAERDLATLEAEGEALRMSELGLLQVDAEVAAGEDRDLLAELASSLREQVADSHVRFERIDRQISAYGK